ncbi:MAG: NUDIX hydrolase [Alphaproteobacteria bacterium]
MTAAAPNSDAKGRLLPDRPWAGVVAVVWREGKFLLTLRGNPPYEGIWGLPGGAIRLGETAFEAAVREVREETGILCRPYASFTTVDVIGPEGSPAPDHHFLLAAIAADWISGEIVPGDDAREARWVAAEELSNLPNVPGTPSS